MKREILKEVRNILEEGKEEIKEEKKVVIDKSTGQVSIRIPRNISLKSNINKNSKFEIVFNLKKDDTKKEIDKSKLVIYLKEVKNEKEKKKKKND